MKQNSFPPFCSFFLIRLERLQEERGELTAVFFAVQSDLLNTEGRKDKRKQKRCWSLSTGRAWLEVSLQQAHWLRSQPITRAAREGKAALPLANCFSVSLHSCWTQCIRYQSGILNYNMNLRHVIHVICNMFFEHFRSRSLSACIINGFNGLMVHWCFL